METSGDDYWNLSTTKPFNFDDNDEVSTSETFGRYRLIADDNISEVSFELPTSDIPLSTLISDNDLKLVLDEQSLEESPFRKGLTQEEELRLLRRKVQDLYHPPPLETIVNKMLLGKMFSLEAYRSLNDKELLLSEVISTGNGDGILGVCIFLNKTLNRKYFNKILMKNTEACNQYLNYLISRMKILEAVDILTMLGRHNDAAMLQFKTLVRTSSDPDIFKQRLKKIFNDYFTQQGCITLFSQIIANAINLLEWQKLEKQSGVAGSDSIMGASALETLFYACSKFRWKDANMNDARSPYTFAAEQQISQAQFEWVALHERAQAQSYIDLENLFEKSKWHSLKQKQFHSNIPLDIIILRLYTLKAPAAVLNSFISKIQDSSKKLNLAKEVKATRSIIDALVSLKEKQELENLKDSLIEGSEERFYAEHSLKTLSKKWSTDGIKLIKN